MMLNSCRKEKKQKHWSRNLEVTCKLLDYKEINEQCILTIHGQYTWEKGQNVDLNVFILKSSKLSGKLNTFDSG